MALTGVGLVLGTDVVGAPSIAELVGTGVEVGLTGIVVVFGGSFGAGVLKKNAPLDMGGIGARDVDAGTETGEF